MKALILAAGYGTRMYPLTKVCPKSLLEISGAKASIDYLVEKCDLLKDVNQIIVVTNDKFFSLFSNWSKKNRLNKSLKIINDGTKNPAQRLGAVGDMMFVIEKEKINDDLLVLAGDNLFDENLEDFVYFCFSHRPHPCLGIHDLKRKEWIKRYGTLMLDDKNRIVEFHEKSNKPLSTQVAMCLYFFPKEKLDLFREYIKFHKDKIDLAGFYIDWLCKKEEVFGFEFKGKWFDIGEEDSYKEAKLIFTKN